MSTPNIDALMRKCRFQPQMGGNREEITVPCALMARLMDLASATTLAAEEPSPERDEGLFDQVGMIERMTDAMLKEGLKITKRDAP